MGRAEEAVGWLQEAASTGFPCYSLFERDPNLDPIRREPRFQALMAEMQKSSASLKRALFPPASDLHPSRRRAEVQHHPSPD